MTNFISWTLHSNKCQREPADRPGMRNLLRGAGRILLGEGAVDPKDFIDIPDGSPVIGRVFQFIADGANLLRFMRSHLHFEGLPSLPRRTRTRSSSNAEKQPIGRGPKGCDENGPAAASLASRSRIDSDMRPLPPVRLGPPCRRPILIATKRDVISGTGH